jgi:hypothetical protein
MMFRNISIKLITHIGQEPGPPAAAKHNKGNENILYSKNR